MRVCLLALCIRLGILPLVAASNFDGQVESRLDRDQVQNILPDVASGVGAPILGVVQTEPFTFRHLEEKKRLLSTLDKSHGTYNEHHPRWRLLKSLWSFSKYREFSKAEVQRWRDMYKSTSKQQKDKLESAVKYREKLNNIEHLVNRNAVICDGIVEHALEFYNIDNEELQQFIREQEKDRRSPDRISVQQALKHYVRNWTVEGTHERKAAFLLGN